MFDVAIIGAGVTGCAIARELSRFRLNIAVLEMGEDVAVATTKANSGIVHAGYDAKPGTLKAEMNIAANPMFERLAQELEFPFTRNGSLVLCFSEENLPDLRDLYERGVNNGVPGLALLDRQQLQELEPNLGPAAIAALHAPTGGIVCPYEMTTAFAENAYDNGVAFYFNHKVETLQKLPEGFLVGCAGGKEFKTKVLINAAGLFADTIHNMLSAKPMKIAARAGQYILLDKAAGALIHNTVFQLPGVMGKGILVSPTIDGNLLIGPTATDQEDKTDCSTNREAFEEIVSAATLTMGTVPVRDTITAFTGLRAHNVEGDFVIEHLPDVPGMIDAAGIESPGLTSAPAIALRVSGLVEELLHPQINADFNPYRKAIPKFREMNTQERNAAIARNPQYGRVVCRCETVTEGEVVASVRRPLGARSLDMVKRRTRAGMGRCQGGFCSPAILEILSRELGADPTAIRRAGPGSNILVGKNKAVRQGGKDA